MPYTQSGADVIAALLRGEAAEMFPDGCWLSAHTSSPGWEGSTAAEITTSAYGIERVELTGILSDMDPDTGMVLTEENIETDELTEDAGDLSHVGFHTAPIGGSMQIYEPMNEVERLLAGMRWQRPAGAIGFNLRRDA